MTQRLPSSPAISPPCALKNNFGSSSYFAGAVGGLSPRSPGAASPAAAPATASPAQKRTPTAPTSSVGIWRDGIGSLIARGASQLSPQDYKIPPKPFYRDVESVGAAVFSAGPLKSLAGVSAGLSFGGARAGGSRGAPPILTVLIRPFYLLSRRGPILPIVIFVVLIFLTANTFSSTEDVPRGSSAGGGQARLRPPSRFAVYGEYLPRAGSLNPIRWAQKQLGRDETDLDDYEDGGNVGLNNIASDGFLGGQRRINVDAAAETNEKVAKTMQRRKDGRALIVAGQKHPIPFLMKRAKRRWKRLNERQSTTFADTIREYRKRYGHAPPRGFDRWYAFARHCNVRLIDEFDMIERDLHAFRATSPASFRARVELLSRQFNFSWGIRVTSGVTTVEGELERHSRAHGVLKLMRRFEAELPDMLMWYSGTDNPRIMIPWEERVRLEQLVAQGQYDEDNDPNFAPKAQGPFPGWGMAQVCAPDSAVRAPGFVYGEATRDMTGFEMSDLPGGSIGTVVDSFKSYMNVCESPQYRHMHTCSSYVFPHNPTPFLPLLTPGVNGQFGDIHSIVVEQFDDEVLHDPTWEERPFDRVVWRGQTSGPQWDKGSAWITSHRSRLHLISHAETGSREIVVTDSRDVAHKVEVANYKLNPLFLDVGMVGPAVQCVQADGTCDEMYKVFGGYETRLSFERANLYKFVLDIDGNSWSGRFRRLMLSQAAVLKATLFPEFWTDWIIPWLHFIPIQIDYSDLWDVLAFYRGGLGGEGAHDALARDISVAGKDWAERHFRWEDLETYQFRLCLEYGRLWSDDREDMSYDGDGAGVEPTWTE